MQVFVDQSLRSHPHLAVFGSSKVGNYVVITPLLRGLKEKYPDCTLDFFGSDVTQDFELYCPYIDWRFSLYSDRDDILAQLAQVVHQRQQVAGSYDLAINCDEFSPINLVMTTALRPLYVTGAALTQDFQKKLDGGENANSIQRLLQDQDWNSSELVERHQGVIQSNYIGEIFCRLAYVETDFFKLELPSQQPNFPVPDILIHVTATRPAKLWPIHAWQQVIQWCAAQGLSVGLVGSAPKIQKTLYNAGSIEDELLQNTALIDLRGQTSLLELAGAFLQTKAFISVDAGPLHIAAAVGCHTIALFGNDVDGDGASPIHLWKPRQPHVHLALSTFKCTLCQEHSFSNKSCLVPDHPCMSHLSSKQVIDYLQCLLKKQDLRKIMKKRTAKTG
ncbi:glycosyltransferase family 9 protein [Nostoc sp.]|uniref:glycosyltransferase family 9 protein n=1 Tax=Nostoc sp. TaxID=1180 RepID=UPI002FF976E5